MSNENVFIAGHVLFLASEALKYKNMNQDAIFGETLHEVDPQTGQYSFRVVHKTAKQKYDELTGDISAKLHALNSSDSEEVWQKINEFTELKPYCNDLQQYERMIEAKNIVLDVFSQSDDLLNN